MIPRMTIDSSPSNFLTPGQLRFVEREQAIPGFPAENDQRMVFMYREDRSRVRRWLVDPAGRVVSADHFRRG